MNQDTLARTISDLAEAIVKADRVAISKALNLVEDKRETAFKEASALLEKLFRSEKQKNCVRIGLTGPPGVGKSTLTASLSRALRKQNKSVGIVAVDPSSMYSGGAILGDRARMSFDPNDQGLFVRSLSTGGDAGGLSYAANADLMVLASAYNWVIAETTGVGQTETDIVHVADTVVLVIQPGSGDVLQFLKAGIMEIPDILVVNKADHEELATRAAADLRGALHAASNAGIQNSNHGDVSPWVPAVVLVSALQETGLEELIAQIESHRKALGPKGITSRRVAGKRQWVLSLIQRTFGDFGFEKLGGKEKVQQIIHQKIENDIHPLTAFDEIKTSFLRAI